MYISDSDGDYIMAVTEIYVIVNNVYHGVCVTGTMCYRMAVNETNVIVITVPK